jgi:hypothetical protein
MVALTSAESDALNNYAFTSADFLSGIGKIAAVVQNLIWIDACQCTSGTLAPPTPPAPPTELTITQVPTPPAVVPCYSVDYTDPIPTCVTPPTGITGDQAQVQFNNTIDSSVTGAALLVPFTTATTNTGVRQLLPGTNQLAYNFISGGTNHVQLPHVVVANNPTSAIVKATSAFGVRDGCPVGLVLIQRTLHVDFYCGGDSPGTVQLPCCPPDVVTQATLDAILRMVTLIQRQNVPFAYVAGTSHTVSGNGQFAIAGLIGLSVAFTPPAQLGSEAGDPTEYFSCGFVTTGDADGWHSSRRLDHTPTLILPISGSDTLVGYSLAPGMSAVITELSREP